MSACSSCGTSPPRIKTTPSYSGNGCGVRFKIDAALTGGLRVISDIPDGELLQLEGRNGIGKTLAIRLLQLATGSQPYLGRPQSWVTLKAHLNPVSITVEGLRDGHYLQLELDPDLWPAKPETPGAWLGEAFLDGERIDWVRVQSILRVGRIGGDETLGESLAAQVAADASLLAQLEDRQAPRRQRWADHVTELRLLTDIPAAFDLQGLRAAARRTSDAVDDADRYVKEAHGTVQASEELTRLLALAASLRTHAPLLRQKIADLTQREQDLRTEVARLDSVAAQVLERDRQSSRIRSEVNRLAGLQRKRRDRRERRRRELAEVSRRAGVGIPVDLNAAQRLLSDLRAERRQLLLQRQTVDRAGLVLELIDAVEVPIDRGLAARLGEESVAQLRQGPLTLGELSEGMEQRRVALEGIDRDAGDAILEQVRRVDRQIAAGQSLPDAVRLLNTAEADLTETTEALAKLLRGLAADVVGEYEEVSDTRAALLDELTQVVEERSQAETDLASLLSEGSLEEVQAAALSAAAQMPEDRDWTDDAAREYLLEAQSNHAEALDRRRTVYEQRDQVQQELSRATSAIRGATSQLVDASQFSWLRATGMALPAPEDDIDQQVAAIADLGVAVQSVEDLLLETLNDLQALQQALTNLDGRLRASGTVGQMQGAPSGELNKPVERYYERRFADELANDMVRAALFGGGTEIAVNLRDMTTSWTLANGDRNTRPLEAFSSGERAFAYTRVQVERLAGIVAENRAIFLDEFGSFVAHDRFEQLKRYLRTQALGRAADKIVVILPLRRTPTEEEQQSLDSSGGYLVRELD